MPRDVQIKIGAQDNASRVIQRVRGSVGLLQSSVVQARASVALASAAITGLAVGAGAAVKKMVDDFSEAGDLIHKTSLRTKLSAEFLSQIGFAAEQSGTSLDQLSQAMFRAFRRIGNAQTGTGPAARAMKELGLNARQLSAMRPERQFFALADAINAVDDANRRSQMGFEIFGDNWRQIAPLIESGTDEIRELMKQMDRLGGTLTGEQARAAAEYTDSINELTTALRGLRNELSAELAPSLTQGTRIITTAISERIRIIELLRIKLIDLKEAAVGVGLVLAPAEVQDNIRQFFNIERGKGLGKIIGEAFSDTVGDLLPKQTREATSGIIWDDRRGLGVYRDDGFKGGPRGRGGAMIFNMQEEPILPALRATQSRLMSRGPAVDPALRQGEKVINEFQQLKDMLAGGGPQGGIPVVEQREQPNEFRMVKAV